MTSYAPTPGDRDCGRDVAAYALGALNGSSAEAFRVHLDTCSVCLDELHAFDEAIDVLAASAPQLRAPRRLKRRVMRPIAANPRAASGQRAAVPAPGLDLRRRHTALALAAILAAVAVVAGALELRGGPAARNHVDQAQIIGVPGVAELRVTGSHGELVVKRLAAPPPGRIYQVWLTRAQQPPTPTTALFSVTAAGAADVEVPGDLRGATGVMVTEEPAGGSQIPTRSAVLRANLN